MTAGRTRLVCTLARPRPGGTRPQDDPEYVRTLVTAGMDVARLNLSHSSGAADLAAGRAPDYAAEERLAAAVRAASDAAGAGRHTAVLLDLQGSKVRLRLPDRDRAAGVGVAAGSRVRVRITRDHDGSELTADGSPALVRCVDAAFAARGPLDVAIGDGDPILRCVALDGDVATLVAPEACRLEHGKGVTFRGVHVRGEPPLTEKDRIDLAAFVLPALASGAADFVALSFVQRPDDVCELRAFAQTAWARLSGRTRDAGEHEALLARIEALRPDLRERLAAPCPRLFVVAKIETAAGADAAAAILHEADGVMVARGDLGLHEAPQDVPRHQKRILREARWLGKPAIVATQMLESMLRDPEPRRSEATDVFNAVLDGADAVMLSGETATGARPREATETLGRIARAAEAFEREERERRDAWLAFAHREVAARRVPGIGSEVTDLITHGAVRAAEDLGAAAVVAATRSGHTARCLARFDPNVTLLAIVPDAAVARSLSLVGSVRAVVAPAASGEEALAIGLSRAAEQGLVPGGARVVVASARAGDPPGVTTTLTVTLAGTPGGTPTAR